MKLNRYNRSIARYKFALKIKIVNQLPDGVFPYKDPEQEAKEILGKDKILKIDLPKINSPFNGISMN